MEGKGKHSGNTSLARQIHTCSLSLSRRPACIERRRGACVSKKRGRKRLTSPVKLPLSRATATTRQTPAAAAAAAAAAGATVDGGREASSDEEKEAGDKKENGGKSPALLSLSVCLAVYLLLFSFGEPVDTRRRRKRHTYT